MNKKENIDIAFVVLHYYTFDDTYKCIESIREKIGTVSYRIVVVDNDSKNDSFNKICNKYQNQKEIILIHNDENLGFARGNNVGYMYIKNNYDAEFIALINNDTYLLQNGFYKLVKDEYLYSKFDVLGPKIILPGDKVNPIQKQLPTYSDIKRFIIKYKLKYFFSLLYLGDFYETMKDHIKNIFHIKTKIIYNYDDVNRRHENIVLHGAFLIFSKRYINTFNGLNDKTFLYLEEKILAVTLKKYKMKAVYNPDIVIYHNEDSSTNAIKKNKRQKNIFVYKNVLKSANILKEILKDDVYA